MPSEECEVDDESDDDNNEEEDILFDYATKEDDCHFSENEYRSYQD